MMVLGIDIGGTHLRALLTNESGAVLSFRKISTAARAGEIVAEIVAITKDMLPDNSSLSDIKAVGIGSTGSIDREKGLIIISPNLPALKGFPLAGALEKSLGIKVYLENDATAALVGEQWTGHGLKYSTWLMITLGTGIGGGAVINNSIYTGRRGSSMEIGHISIDYRGKRCPCGNTGCLELYASATAMAAFTKARLGRYPQSSLHSRLQTQKLSSKIIYEEARRGDALSLLAFKTVSTHLGFGIVNLMNLFNPEAIIFGGGLSRAHRLILPIVKNIVEERALSGFKNDVKYLVSKDEEKVPALGAAKIALDHYTKGV